MYYDDSENNYEGYKDEILVVLTPNYDSLDLNSLI